MALQLLKRNYTMQGYEQPKILKDPMGEVRCPNPRVPVDVGDVMMNVRMDSGKNKFIAEHVSKYAQGINPYGEFGYPYKVNKAFRPPIDDPKFYAAASRMPVKFDSIARAPIVKDNFASNQKIDINSVAPKTITDKVCSSGSTNPSLQFIQTMSYPDKIELVLNRPAASVQSMPSMPIHLNTGVPEIELDSKIFIRPNMGIHFPYNISDQSIDYMNMRTPMHIAVAPGPKNPYTVSGTTPLGDIQLDPKLNTPASSNPGYTIIQHGCNDTAVRVKESFTVSGQTNVSDISFDAPHGKQRFEDRKLQLGGFYNEKGSVPRFERTEREQGGMTISDGKFKKNMNSSMGYTPIANMPVQEERQNEPIRLRTRLPVQQTVVPRNTLVKGWD